MLLFTNSAAQTLTTVTTTTFSSQVTTLPTEAIDLDALESGSGGDAEGPHAHDFDTHEPVTALSDEPVLLIPAPVHLEDISQPGVRDHEGASFQMNQESQQYNIDYHATEQYKRPPPSPSPDDEYTVQKMNIIGIVPSIVDDTHQPTITPISAGGRMGMADLDGILAEAVEGTGVKASTESGCLPDERIRDMKGTSRHSDYELWTQRCAEDQGQLEGNLLSQDNVDVITNCATKGGTRCEWIVGEN